MARGVREGLGRQKAIIQSSLRSTSTNHLWFTFFHVAGHLNKHGRKEVFVAGNGLDGEKEEEANAFARDKLIPPAALKRFLARWSRSDAEIESFARQIGITPGIVVCRLQRDRRLANCPGNQLKVFYRWSEDRIA